MCNREGLRIAIGSEITKYDKNLKRQKKKNGLQNAMGLQSATDYKVYSTSVPQVYC